MDAPPQTLSPPTGRFASLVRGGLVVMAIFFLASFPARHADIWGHLATGRALIHGVYSFGVDPFSYMTEGAVWVNHAWLFDVGVYGLQQTLGGTALVVAKALLMAGLSACLLALCWRGSLNWSTVILILLAAVAMSPYLLLRPVVFSVCLLGLTYAWLERHGTSASWKRSALLLALFVLWANMDEWFLLGPALAALWSLGALVGSRPHPVAPPKTGEKGLPLLLLAIAGALLACLNPHHVRVFTVPALLDPAGAEPWIDDVADVTARQSPRDWLASEGSLEQPARVAYGLLALAGAVSFLWNGRQVVGARLLIWMALLALSLYRSGAIPFFAVVAGPLTALNLGDAWARAAPPGPPSKRARLLQGIAQVVGYMALGGAVLAAWSGWSRGLPGEPRRWDLVLDPSLEAAARQLDAWRAAGKLSPEARGLPTSAAAAYVLAWVAPDQKSFCDGRPHLYPPEVRADFAAMRRALFSSGSDPKEAAEWRGLLQKHRIAYLIVDEPVDDHQGAALLRLFGSGKWSVRHLQGRTVVLAARDGPPPITAPEVDPWARAWRPTAAELAPTAWPGRDPARYTWLDVLTPRSAGSALDRDECLVWLAYFDSQRESYALRMRGQWSLGLTGSLVGLPAGEAGATGVMPGVLLRYACLAAAARAQPTERPAPLEAFAGEVLAQFSTQYDEGPPGALLASVRAGRRALSQDPDDALAHLHLGRAYLRLRRHTSERSTLGTFRFLEHVRRIQSLTELQHAARLQPDLAPAHEALTSLYQELGYHDLALAHVQAALAFLGAQEPPRGESPALRRARIQYWQEQELQLARIVRDAQVATRGKGLDAYQRARLAHANGLPMYALELLLRADAASVGRDGFLLTMDLLLDTGQTHEVRESLRSELERTFGVMGFRWLRGHLAVASGDYAQADADLAGPEGTVDLLDLRLKRVPLEQALPLLLGAHLLDRAANLRIALIHDERNQQPLLLSEDVRLRTMIGVALQMRQIADVAALRGALALEAGDNEAARRELTRCTQLSSDPHGAGGVARHYLKLLDERR